MSPDLPYALGCPSCVFHVEVSDEDPDASLSYLAGHIFETNKLLAEARELTAEEVAQ